MKFLGITALTIAIGLTICGQTQTALAADKPAGRLAAEMTFASIDTTDKGYIHQGDLEGFRSSVFAGMDYDDTGRVSYPEFAAWDPGFSSIAAEEGKSDAYVTASKIVFAFWDRNGDGEINDPEMRFAMNADFRRADLNDDGVLSQQEFIQGFAVIVAMRAAIRPDL
jgi:Ca2+-binding EF-hand superfamily protein